MVRCSQCETLVLFGGKSERGLRFCSVACARQGVLLIDRAERIEPHVAAALEARHQGRCPLCAGPGPVDVHWSHFAYSVVVYTSWKSISRVSCRPCALRSQFAALLRCVALGWWGIPLGLLITPLQIARNLAGLLRPPDPGRPSAALERRVRGQLVEANLHPETAGPTSSRRQLQAQREQKAMLGELSTEERLSVLLERLLEFEQIALQRRRPIQVDARSGKIAALCIALPGAALLGSALASGTLSSGLLCAALLIAPLGLGWLAHSLATDCRRFIRTRLCEPMREALRPFQPSALELEQLISSMRAGHWVLGRYLRSDWLRGDRS